VLDWLCPRHPQELYPRINCRFTRNVLTVVDGSKLELRGERLRALIMLEADIQCVVVIPLVVCVQPIFEENDMSTYQMTPEAVARLSPKQYRVTRQSATEAPGSGELLDRH
jgi:hypothetical protein